MATAEHDTHTVPNPSGRLVVVTTHHDSDDLSESARAVYVGAGASVVVEPGMEEDGTARLAVAITDLSAGAAAQMLRTAADAIETHAARDAINELFSADD